MGSGRDDVGEGNGDVEEASDNSHKGLLVDPRCKGDHRKSSD